MKWSDEIDEGGWWLDRLEPHGARGIRSLVPARFEAIARIFHPVLLPSGELTTWAALAESNGRVAHAKMQLHSIATDVTQRPDLRAHDGPDAYVGNLPAAEMNLLAAELERWTTTAHRCWLGVWEAYGQLHGGGRSLHFRKGIGWHRGPKPEALVPSWLRESPRVTAPGRNYLLLTGALSQINEAAE